MSKTREPNHGRGKLADRHGGLDDHGLDPSALSFFEKAHLQMLKTAEKAENFESHIFRLY